MKSKKINSFVFLLLLLLPINAIAQNNSITVSGITKDKSSEESLPFVNIVLKKASDSSFVSGTISNDKGLFTFTEVPPGNYILSISFIGYKNESFPLFIGSNSEFIDLGSIYIEQSAEQLGEVVIQAKKDAVSSTMAKKEFNVDDNISQSGGSVLQSMSNLPGVTIQDNQLQLRGNNKVVVLIDGKQTAITGFGNQNGLDNIPASAVEKIEIINNPSAKYDANGNAGIINIVLKKEKQKGLNGKAGISAGIGALWIRKENLEGIRPQYQNTPKLNPSLSLNYRKNKVNIFLQADNLYSETLNRNEFVTRTYDDGRKINQQLKRNRNTNFLSTKAGIDWSPNEKNTFTISGSYSQESIKDRGDQPFFNGNSGESLRKWTFLEDEVLTAVMTTVAYEHRFIKPGHKLNMTFNYTFDREDEKYFFSNTLPSFMTDESFYLIADQQVIDISIDHTRPMKHGLLESGFKFRKRNIPTDMQFNPSLSNSVLDTGADGKATYDEIIPALYSNYTYEIQKLEMEVGLRMEYVELNYEVDPNHNTYQSDGYNYLQPFPNARITYKINERKKISAFYNRRVDRPDEVDIRIFPKYDDAEIIKVGNPALRPQFTNSFELGYKYNWKKGYFYGAVYHRISNGAITRVATTTDSSTIIYNISQNAGNSYNTGSEIVINQDLNDKIDVNLNVNVYHNQIDEFAVTNQYPVKQFFISDQQEIYSGNIKLNTNVQVSKNTEAQLTAVYLAPDIIPQGTIDARYSIDAGIKMSIQNGKGSVFVNAKDLLNTMVIRKTINGSNFKYTSANYYETQAIRLGYSYKF